MILDRYIDWYTDYIDSLYMQQKMPNTVYAYCWSAANVYYDARGMEEKKKEYLSDMLNEAALPDFLYEKIS